MDFLYHFLVFFLDCTDQVEKDNKRTIQLENCIFSMRTEVSTDNCLSCLHFWQISLEVISANKLLHQPSTKVALNQKMFLTSMLHVKVRSSAILIPKTIHLKFVRMKLLNCKSEARNSMKNINEGSSLVQQKYRLSHLWD